MEGLFRFQTQAEWTTQQVMAALYWNKQQQILPQGRELTPGNRSRAGK